MFVGRCVCFCVCAKEGRLALGLSLLKSYTSGLFIWKGCCAGQTHTEKERRQKGEREGCFYCFRASFSINLSSRYVDSAQVLQ